MSRSHGGAQIALWQNFLLCSTFPECDVIVNDLEQIRTKYPDHPRTPFQKKEKKGKKGVSAAKSKTAKAKTVKAKQAKTKEAKAPKAKTTRIMPSYQLSPLLAEVVGVSELSRGEVTKKVWDYIKAHQLQDSANKRLIRPDALLARVFGSEEPIDMFKMAGLLNAHMKK